MGFGKQYVQKEWNPVSTGANPTVRGLMGARDRKDFVKIKIPVKTKLTDIMYQPITLNSNYFEPGKEYEVHPLIAAEVNAAIERFEDSILKQMRKGTPEISNEIIAEFDAGEDLEG